jgi:hypothetical protein
MGREADPGVLLAATGQTRYNGATLAKDSWRLLRCQA